MTLSVHSEAQGGLWVGYADLCFPNTLQEAAGKAQVGADKGTIGAKVKSN